VVDFSARKKLFRPQAAASPGLGEQDEFLGGAHSADCLSLSVDEDSLLSAFDGIKARK
jgi:hypothetical protein